jgi:hypothetical protein
VTSEREIASVVLPDRAIGGQPDAGATASPSVDPTGPSSAHHRYTGRLFRKYLLLILSLVTIALLASGAISVYFSYQEN